MCGATFLSSHYHLTEKGHFTPLDNRLHFLGHHSEANAMSSFLVHLLDRKEGGQVYEEAEDISEFEEAEEIVEEVDDDDDDDNDDEVDALEGEEEEGVEGEQDQGQGDGNGDGEEPGDGLTLNVGPRRRRRRRRGGGKNGDRKKPDHPRLKRYVERCPGSCILTRLRRQNARVHTGNASHFDAIVSSDDGSECKGKCSGHGFCKEDKCVCMALYEGEYCDRPRPLPKGLHSAFDKNDFVLNAETLKRKVGQIITYKTNPKKGDGLTHTLKLSVSEQMVNLLPESDILSDKFFETCAIVGSSGVLLASQKGKEIDSHSAVIRFNKAPTKGFEKYVGSKTTLRLVNTNHALMMHENETIIQQMQSRTGWLIYRKIMKQTSNESNHYAFHPDFSTYVSSNTRALPTNGYFALFLALQRCQKVRMYGFLHSSKKYSYHYFNRERPTRGGSAIHDYAAEHVDILRLANASVIEMM
ncbi:sialyltransferase [Chloropicon primus]|uniref:Sialyltransferase n=1 Tax=Chloropicon primus TaxID=1764295 RepID=A0A5B8MRV4_9CHLO|nr:sialyltransferase [Chloropicon primus]|eukprot:QDZ23141.1 sialyltransferase [Chloropicon primus]